MEYKVSYNKVWSAEGTTYDQTIKIKCTYQKLAKINKDLEIDYLFIDPRKAIYLHQIKDGVNYTTLTTKAAVCADLGLNKDRRVLDRNTRIIVVLTNKKK